MKKEINKTVLYMKDNSQSIRVWSIHAEDNTIIIERGVLGGESIISTEDIHCGLANRTISEQVEMRIKSRVNKKIDAGYVHSLEDAKLNQKTNSLGFLKAMKCSRYDEEQNKIPYDETYVQPKLDGHHCSIVKSNGELIAYSSNGKIITTIDHILKEIDIPEGTALEGELYHHGTIIQTIGSWVKKLQPNSLKLHYHVYDIVSSDCYSKRYKMLKTLTLGSRASVLETALIKGRFETAPILAGFIRRGYEGAVFRLLDHPYRPGARSKGVIKVKPMHFDDGFAIDDEFLVVNIASSKDGWAILHCETDKGAPFKVACPGSVKEKTKVYLHREFYIGRHIKVQFSGWTNDKKPFHPVALMWREKYYE